MSKVCTLTGRKPSFGRKFTRRGIAKYKGGIGLKITGQTARRFLPNLKKKRVWDPEINSFVTIRMSVAAMRTVDKNGLGTVVRKLIKKFA